MGEAKDEEGESTRRPVVAFLRGDHHVNETKLNAVSGTTELRPMTADQLGQFIGGPAGFLGPVGLKEVMARNALAELTGKARLHQLQGVLRDDGVRAIKTIVVMDLGLEGRKNLVAGANKLDFHYRNVTPGRDFKPTLTADIRNVNEGELDPIGGELLRLGRAVEVGHIFKLGYKYSESMGARVLDANGKEVMPIMGCYGIGIERILTAAIESSAAKFARETATEQYALPVSIAPFEFVVTVTNVREAGLREAGEKLAEELEAAGIDVLLDDRDERAGVKFKDAELIGVPYRINIGKKLAEGKVELVDRLKQTTLDIPFDSTAMHVSSLLAASKQ